MTEKRKTWARDQWKGNSWSAENKKSSDLDELAREPAIRSYDTGQRKSRFDTRQLTTLGMTIIRLNPG